MMTPNTPPGMVLVPREPTPEMVKAYLLANDAYWERADKMPRPPDKWRAGKPTEAVAESYKAAIAAAPDTLDSSNSAGQEAAARVVKNQLCIDGTLNKALDDIMCSSNAVGGPDATFNILSGLAHDAVDRAFAAAAVNPNTAAPREQTNTVPVPRADFDRALVLLNCARLGFVAGNYQSELTTICEALHVLVD